MLDLAGGTTVYLACGVTDLRKSYNGLAAIIKLKFHFDPYSRCMFAFCNRRRTSIKILQWDGSGFWILMKKLDKNSFHWPDTPDELQKVTLKEMHWLCDGLSLNPQGAFKERHPKIIVWKTSVFPVNPQKHEISAVFSAISYIYDCCFFWIKPYTIWYNLSIRLQAGEQIDGSIVYKRTTQ